MTETWFSDNFKNSELSLGAGYDVVSRNDRRAGKHGGLLIADTKLSSLHVTDISISDYHFSFACVLHSDTLLFYLLIYNPPASSSYHVHFDDLSVCLRIYFQLFEKIRNQYVCLMLFTYWEISTYPVSIRKLTLDPLVMSALFWS